MKFRSALAGVSALTLGLGLMLPPAASAAAPSTSSLSLAALEQAHPMMQHQLSYGDRNLYVATMQADLSLSGYPQVGPIDGIFGPLTLAALQAFQKDHGLPVTGVSTPATWQELLSQFGLCPPYTSQEGDATAAITTAQNATTQTTAPTSTQSGTIAGHTVIAVYHMIATAYGPSLQDNYPYGATDVYGDPLQSGMIAVDPSVIPLRSYVWVSGYTNPNLPQGGFLGRAMDTGSAIQGHRIDIFINAPDTTVSNFGIQPVTVTLLGN